MRTLRIETFRVHYWMVSPGGERLGGLRKSHHKTLADARGFAALLRDENGCDVVRIEHGCMVSADVYRTMVFTTWK